jgi:hypothetical protein
MTKGYNYHWNKARELWIEKFYNKHNPDYEHWKQYRQMLMPDELTTYDDELRYALDSFSEMEQVKLIYDNLHGNCLKIKWESGAWWSSDPMHFYYCVLLPIDDIELHEPFALTKIKPARSHLTDKEWAVAIGEEEE